MTTRIAASPLLLAFLLLPLAPATAGDDFEIPVKEKVLDNGLKVLVVENPTAQTVSCRLFFRVGSANEQPGLTGLAHFFEHLMFKGTKRIGVKDLEADARLMKEIDAVAAEMRALRLADAAKNARRLAELKKELSELIEQQREVVKKNETMELYRKAGGTGINASTSRDFTQYQVTLPAHKLELFMWVEADRLQNAIFREFHAEKDVVREERRLSENRPTYAFGEAMNQITYGSHPYAWPVVGFHEDLVNATREDAQAFWDTFYVPDNAVMVLAGKVEASKAFAMAERYFASIPRGTRPRPVVGKTPPPATGERRLVARAQTQPQLSINYYRHPIGHPDEAVYQVIAGLLSGSSGRLEQSIVRKQDLATGVNASAFPSRYLSTFSLSGVTKGDTNPKAVLAAIDAELDRLKNETIRARELQKAKNGFRGQLLAFLGTDEIFSIIVGFFEIMDDQRGWRGLNQLFKEIEKVTAADVKRVANELFRDENRVVGLLYGKDEAPKTEAPAAKAPATEEKKAEPAGPKLPEHPDALSFAEKRFVPPAPGDLRFELANGLRVFIKEDRRLPIIQITANIAGGDLWDPAGKEGLASAAGSLMKRGGTQELDEDALDDRLDFLAANLSSGFGEASGSVSLRCFDKDIEEGLNLLRDVLVTPAFRADRLERWKSEALQAIARRNDSPGGISGREFNRALYGEHPHARLSSPESIAAITREDLVALHRHLVSPKNTILSVSGNFDQAAMLTRLKAVFGSWEGDDVIHAKPPAPTRSKAKGILFIEKASSQGYVSVGHLSVERGHPDADALSVMNAVLRRRIFNRVRTDEGLAYSAYSRFSAPSLYPGVIGAGFQSKSASVAFALKLVFEELEKIREEAIPEEELDSVKQGLIDAFPGRFSNANAIVSLFAGQELSGRDLAEITRYTQRIERQTAAGILEAAKRHLRPDDMTIHIVGDKAAILAGDGQHDAKLTDFGPIIDVELEAPKVELEETPTVVVEKAAAALKAGDIDALFALFTEEVREGLAPQKAQLEARLRSPMIQNLVISVKKETIDGDKAKVDVMFVIEFQGQKIEQPRALSLVKKEGRWLFDQRLF